MAAMKPNATAGIRRKADHEVDNATKARKPNHGSSVKSPTKRQLDIKTVLGSPVSSQSETSDVAIGVSANLPFPTHQPSSKDPFKLVQSSTLSPFRKRVLLALSQVPKSRFTTYAAISDHLGSSPRAVGNALRNNPFAPTVPCHRVVAADKALGGFGGHWGMEGKFAQHKVQLLREEGVVVDVGKGKVVGEVWKGFK
ncbi:MAG: hypothetical protein LQ351_000458 [Letrouitia transgressa]|nr:MAG: hypothetical protein LQ351_000458 [Letrouitia transgressa]